MAKKRYYQSKKDRKDESIAMEALVRKAHDNKYRSRHSKEFISADWSAPALLPQNVIQKEYYKTNDYLMGYMDDLYDGVEIQLERQRKELKKIVDPTK